MLDVVSLWGNKGLKMKLSRASSTNCRWNRYKLLSANSFHWDFWIYSSIKHRKACNWKFNTDLHKISAFYRYFWWGKSKDLMQVSFMLWRYLRRQLWKVRIGTVAAVSVSVLLCHWLLLSFFYIAAVSWHIRVHKYVFATLQNSSSL